jgi:pyruvate formate lyase activating enzyme
VSEDRSERGLVFDIQSYAIHDGPGVRTLVFLKGCPLECWWCHNPEGRSPKPEPMYSGTLCTHRYGCVSICPVGAIAAHHGQGIGIDRGECTGCDLCTGACPTGALKLVGRWMDVKSLADEIGRYHQLYNNPDAGVTFSGGEPLFQPKFLAEVLKACKEQYIHTAIETSGYTSPRILESILPYVNMFLFDLKVFDEEDSRTYTGVSSRRIKENLKFLVAEGEEIVLRFPIVPGITDTEANVKHWAQFLSDLKGPKQIDLLPYHDVGEKFGGLGQEYRMKVHHAPSKATLKRIRQEFERIGLDARIGT